VASRRGASRRVASARAFRGACPLRLSISAHARIRIFRIYIHTSRYTRLGKGCWERFLAKRIQCLGWITDISDGGERKERGDRGRGYLEVSEYSRSKVSRSVTCYTHTHTHIHTWGNRDVHCQDNARENPFYRRKNMKKKGDENLEGTTDEPDIPAPLSLSLTHFLSL